MSAERRDMPADEVVMPQTSLVPLPSTLVKVRLKIYCSVSCLERMIVLLAEIKSAV